jgi:hypothetical protein
VKEKTGHAKLSQVRIAPLPAGSPLPKDTVHLEITIFRDSVETPPSPPLPMPTGKKPAPGATPKGMPPVHVTAAPRKSTPRKPVVVHFFAISDAGKTWIAFGLDPKLVSIKAASALSSTVSAATLAQRPGFEGIRDAKVNGGGFFTLRGFLVMSAMKAGGRSPWRALEATSDAGGSPNVFTFTSLPPSGDARTSAGSLVASLRVPRAVVEDFVRLAVH